MAIKTATVDQVEYVYIMILSFSNFDCDVRYIIITGVERFHVHL